MSLNDIFGQFPGRPDHPDFARLSEIVLQQDGRSYDPDFDYGEYMARYIDPASIRHMAQQRCQRTLESLGRSPGYEMVLAAMGAAWLDAFVAGYTFHERKTAATVEELLTALLGEQCSRISDRSTDTLNDWQRAIDAMKERAAALGVEWKDSFIPNIVRDMLAPDEDDE